MDDTWRAHGLTNDEVMDRLRVGIRTVQGWAKEGRLRHARDKRGERGQWVTVYHPDDVAELAAERQPGPPTPFLVPVTASNGNGHSAGLQIAPPPAVDPEGVRTMAAFVLAVLTELRKDAPQDPQATQGAQGPQTEKPILTLTEAVQWSGWSRTYLLRKIHTGTLKAEKDGGWKIRKTDLEQL